MSELEERRIVAAAYITEEESAWLDARAKKLGTSRSAVLRSFITKATRRKRHHKEYPCLNAATGPDPTQSILPSEVVEVGQTQTIGKKEGGPPGGDCVIAGGVALRRRVSTWRKS